MKPLELKVAETDVELYKDRKRKAITAIIIGLESEDIPRDEKELYDAIAAAIKGVTGESNEFSVYEPAQPEPAQLEVSAQGTEEFLWMVLHTVMGRPEFSGYKCTQAYSDYIEIGVRLGDVSAKQADKYRGHIRTYDTLGAQIKDAEAKGEPELAVRLTSRQTKLAKRMEQTKYV